MKKKQPDLYLKQLGCLTFSNCGWKGYAQLGGRTCKHLFFNVWISVS